MYNVCITIDLEEFSLPLDFNRPIEKAEMLKISLKGYKNLKKILDRYKIKCTFFTTVFFAKNFPHIIKEIKSKYHEIALHGNIFPQNKKFEYLKKEKNDLEEIIHKKIYGFRSHQLQKINFGWLSKLMFVYDSSIHPTYFPGRYNNLKYPTSFFKIQGIIEIPISVSPYLRLPLSWIWFRNFGLHYTKTLSLFCLKKNNFINIYFHPWDFIEIENFNLPFLIKRNCGQKMINIFDKYIKWVSKYNCITLFEFVQTLNKDFPVFNKIKKL